MVYGLKAIKGDFGVWAKGQLMCCSWKFLGDTKDTSLVIPRSLLGDACSFKLLLSPTTRRLMQCNSMPRKKKKRGPPMSEAAKAWLKASDKGSYYKQAAFARYG